MRAGTVGEGFDGAGDGLLGGQHLDRRVALLAGAGDTDQRDDVAAGEDAVEDPVQLGRVPPVQAGRDFGDEVGAGEHLVPRQQPPVDIEHLGGESRRSRRRSAGTATPRSACLSRRRGAAVRRSSGQPAASSSARHPGSSSSAPVWRFTLRVARAATLRAR